MALPGASGNKKHPRKSGNHAGFRGSLHLSEHRYRTSSSAQVACLSGAEGGEGTADERQARPKRTNEQQQLMPKGERIWPGRVFAPGVEFVHQQRELCQALFAFMRGLGERAAGPDRPMDGGFLPAAGRQAEASRNPGKGFGRLCRIKLYRLCSVPARRSRHSAWEV